MPRILPGFALLPMLLAASAALAQTPGAATPAGPDAASATARPVQDATAPAPRLVTPAHMQDKDARGCLDYVTNRGIIRCAEKYRYPGERRSR